jgi:hypothetical protein
MCFFLVDGIVPPTFFIVANCSDNKDAWAQIFRHQKRRCQLYPPPLPLVSENVASYVFFGKKNQRGPTQRRLADSRIRRGKRKKMEPTERELRATVRPKSRVGESDGVTPLIRTRCPGWNYGSITLDGDVFANTRIAWTYDTRKLDSFPGRPTRITWTFTRSRAHVHGRVVKTFLRTRRLPGD